MPRPSSVLGSSMDRVPMSRGVELIGPTMFCSMALPSIMSWYVKPDVPLGAMIISADLLPTAKVCVLPLSAIIFFTDLTLSTKEVST